MLTLCSLLLAIIRAQEMVAVGRKTGIMRFKYVTAADNAVAASVCQLDREMG